MIVHVHKTRVQCFASQLSRRDIVQDIYIVYSQLEISLCKLLAFVLVGLN